MLSTMPSSPASSPSPASPSVRIYVDFISPYAYVGWFAVQGIAARHGRTVEPIPVLFGALLDANGQKGPAEIPSKRLYTFKDAYRKAHKFGLGPLKLPPSHPFNPLMALRVASLPNEAPVQKRIIDALYRAAWADGGAIDTAESVTAVLDAAGLEGAALVEKTRDPAVKEALRMRTADALARGVFGVPSIEIDGEIFFGTDSLEFVEAFLRGEDVVPKDLAWADRPATAQRKGLRG
jgi:2-hydroxychromene-2-carboxylate isomerase